MAYTATREYRSWPAFMHDARELTRLRIDHKLLVTGRVLTHDDGDEHRAREWEVLERPGGPGHDGWLLLDGEEVPFSLISCFFEIRLTRGMFNLD